MEGELMAKYTGPKFKIARRLGVNVFGHPKALKRGIKKTKKLSEYGEQLMEKQKLKYYYGIFEIQLKRYVSKALRSRENSGEKLVQNLERRLDNVLYRLGFASTLAQARQMVVHGHALVNGKKVDKPSFSVCVGDIISLSGKSEFIRECNDKFVSSSNPYGYLEKDVGRISGRMSRLPLRTEVPIEVRDSKVLEFYSR
jgi:small subunit ribosomal protein S4